MTVSLSGIRTRDALLIFVGLPFYIVHKRYAALVCPASP